MGEAPPRDATDCARAAEKELRDEVGVGFLENLRRDDARAARPNATARLTKT